MLPIWTWECDHNGIYTTCSPEIILCLGISPEKTLQQPIYSFRVDKNTATLLKEGIRNGKVPTEIDSLFQNSQDEWVKVKINFFEQKDVNGDLTGWHGFNQIVLPETLEAKATVETTATPLPEVLRQPFGSTDIGIAIAYEQTKPATNFWTGLAHQANISHQTQTQNGRPAVIAVPFNFGDNGAGVIEIVDDHHERTWNEEDTLMVEEVSLQLASMLEKILLKAVLSQEIQERTRAEKEILRRNQDLARLHQISQQLGKQTKPEEVYDFLYKTLGEMIDNRNLIIAIYDKNQEPAFPVVSHNGQFVTIRDEPYAASILKYVTEEKSPLLITGNHPEEFVSHRLVLPEKRPLSLVAVPLMAGDRPIGAIILQDYESEKTYNFIHMELLSTIAMQTTAILDNVNLFQEIHLALKAIETRERYQAKIARAVATLSQSGSASLGSVFELIGQATQCTRITYIQLFEAGDENRWKIIKTWNSPDYKPSPNDSADYQISIDSLKSEDNYPEKGWITGPLLTQAGIKPDKTHQTIGSFLLLTVPGKNLWRSYISIEQLGSQRTWQIEEIDILKVAADALSNTIIREGLMEQLQVSLNESESLYNASHHLALAANAKEMLAALSANLAPPQITKSILVLFLRNENDRIIQMNTLAVWQNIKTGLLAPKSPEIFSISLLHTFQRSTPAFYDDVRMAPVDEELRSTLIERNILAMAIMPLWAGKRQLGFLALCSERPYHFTNREMRTYPPLVDQMAIAIENAHAYELSQQAVREMKDVDHLKSQFLATMTHELRSPLNSIIGFSQVILKGIDGPINEPQKHDLTAIYDSGQLLLSLINDVLDLSKIEAGKMELAFSRVNMTDVIQSVLSTTQGLVKNKPIKLKSELQPLPAITADPIRIRQVLINLLSNAAKFTEMGSITVKAWLETQPEGKKEVWVTVSDTGVGISQENQKKLFQAFTQVDASHTRRTGGSGLGLSISSSLINLHHGRIGIMSSVPNQGSTFFFTLPVEQPDENIIAPSA